jgi:hypothetical protein
MFFTFLTNKTNTTNSTNKTVFYQALNSFIPHFRARRLDPLVDAAQAGWLSSASR